MYLIARVKLWVVTRIAFSSYLGCQAGISMKWYLTRPASIFCTIAAKRLLTMSGNGINYTYIPGLNSTMALRQASSDLSIFISLILATSSVRTLSNIRPTPAWWAESRVTWRPEAKIITSCTESDLWEKLAMRSSFQPTTAERINVNKMHQHKHIHQQLTLTST